MDQLNCTLLEEDETSRQASYQKNLIWWWHTDTAIEESCALPLRGGAKTHHDRETEPSLRLQPLCAAKRAPRHTLSMFYARTHQRAQRQVATDTQSEKLA